MVQIILNNNVKLNIGGIKKYNNAIRGTYMEDTITRKEHEEFARRIEEENVRQNHRISALEDNVKEIHGLTVSVERMAVNMENMLNAIERQGNLIEKQNERIDKIEEEPANDYKQIKMAIITAIISAVVGTVVGAALVLL